MAGRNHSGGARRRAPFSSRLFLPCRVAAVLAATVDPDAGLVALARQRADLLARFPALPDDDGAIDRLAGEVNAVVEQIARRPAAGALGALVKLQVFIDLREGEWDGIYDPVMLDGVRETLERLAAGV